MDQTKQIKNISDIHTESWVFTDHQISAALWGGSLWSTVLAFYICKSKSQILFVKIKLTLFESCYSWSTAYLFLFSDTVTRNPKICYEMLYEVECQSPSITSIQVGSSIAKNLWKVVTWQSKNKPNYFWINFNPYAKTWMYT